MVVTTSTTGTTYTTVTVTSLNGWQYQPLSEKERKRRAQIQARHARWKARTDEMFQEEMRKIREWSEANAWRPSVSFNETTAGLHYWTLAASNEENPDVPMWRTIYNRYKKKGWLGLTINCPTPKERAAIDEVIASVPKKYKIVEYDENDGWRRFRESYNIDEAVGSYYEHYMDVWFARLEDHNRLVEALERYPRVTQMMLISPDKRQAIDNLFTTKDVNYKVIDGENGSCVIFSEIDDTTMVMLRLFGTGEAFPLR